MKIQQITPETHIFLWDLHDVILEKKMRHWFLISIQFNRKWELIRRLNKKSLIIFFTFCLERLGMIKKQMVSEELIYEAQKTGNDALVELIKEVCSAYTPIEKTVEIMNKLSTLGYKHHLGSNIGQTVYNRCLTKFPTIFSLFQGNTIPFINEKKELVKKPHKDFFTNHIQKYQLKADQFIFIDDKIDNVQAAQITGMHGIHFKGPELLHAQLVALNIFTD